MRESDKKWTLNSGFNKKYELRRFVYLGRRIKYFTGCGGL